MDTRRPLLPTLLLALVLLPGCTGLQTIQHAPTEPDQLGRTESYWRYGNFCGRKHPAIPEGLPVQEEVRLLLDRPPVDDVDMACQFHDVCYAISGGPSRICDKVLGWNLTLLRPSISQVRRDLFGYYRDESPHFIDGCSRLIAEIEHYADVSSALNAEDLRDMIVDGLGGVVSVVVSSPGLLIGSALGRTRLVPGAELSPCVSSEEPSLLFPVSTLEINALRHCYQIEGGFSSCKQVTARGRSNHHTATGGPSGTGADPR